MEYEDLRSSASQAYTCMRNHTEPRSLYKGCHTLWRKWFHVVASQCQLLIQTYETITLTKMNLRLLGAEREEEVKGDSVLLSLFSLPDPTVKKQNKKILILSRMFPIPSWMTLVFLLQIFCVRVFHMV